MTDLRGGDRRPVPYGLAVMDTSGRFVNRPYGGYI